MTRISLMITCLGDALFPQVGLEAARVLRELDCRVDSPSRQVCCGQAAFNSGCPDAARRSAEAFLHAFSDSEAVVCVSGSCTAMVRHHYQKLFADSSLEQEALRLGGRTYEFSEFLVDVLGVQSLPVACRRKATFHRSCHTSRLLGIVEAPERLLAMVEGLDYHPLARPGDCCGFGGTFSIKYPQISIAMVDEKVDDVLSTGAELLLGLDMSCLMNIEGRLRRRGAAVEVKHLAQLLGEGWQR